MSRSGYVDFDEVGDHWRHICWRGAVKSALRGKRGQALLGEAIAALDALPDKRLIGNEFVESGEFCTLGAVARHRGIDITDLDPECPDKVASRFGVSGALVQEIMYMNDEGVCWQNDVTPEARWEKMRDWLESQITPEVK